MRNIRIFYSKTGLAKYVSHLDMIRLMTRAIRRAELPFRMTEGFNPHIYISFPLPLSLGIESEREAMDTSAPEELSLEEIKERLNRAMPEDMSIIEVSEPLIKHTEIDRAEYEIVSCASPDKLRAFFESEEIKTEKKTKKGIAVIDLKPLIYQYRVEGEKTTLLLPAGTELNINPQLVFDAYSKQSGELLPSLVIKRTKILCKNDEIFS